MIRNAEAGSWRRMSQFHVLTDDQIISALSETSNVIRAVSFDRKTNYAAIAIPAHSPYLELTEFRRLIDLLDSLGLKPRVYKASGSDDVQLFLFLTDEMKTDLVSESLSKVLSWNGFFLRPDKLVAYPSDCALPLPLQLGFAWLNDDLQPIVSRMEIALDSALALFCSEASRYATDFQRVIDSANLLPSPTLTDAEFWGVSPHSAEDTSADSQVLEEILDETPEFSFACAMPENQPEIQSSGFLNTFPLWLVQEDLTVEVFPIPVEQEVIEEMLLDECADDLEQQTLVVQGQTNADEQWPRQTSQLLLVTNERPADLQLDLFSARKNSNKGEQPTPRSRRKRPRSYDDKPKPEV